MTLRLHLVRFPLWGLARKRALTGRAHTTLEYSRQAVEGVMFGDKSRAYHPAQPPPGGITGPARTR